MEWVYGKTLRGWESVALSCLFCGWNEILAWYFVWWSHFQDGIPFPYSYSLWSGGLTVEPFGQHQWFLSVEHSFTRDAHDWEIDAFLSFSGSCMLWGSTVLRWIGCFGSLMGGRSSLFNLSIRFWLPKGIFLLHGSIYGRVRCHPKLLFLFGMPLLVKILTKDSPIKHDLISWIGF